MAKDPRDNIARLVAEARRTYGDAVATTVEGGNPEEAWDAWERVTAALLLASWATGAQITMHAVGAVPKPKAVMFDRTVPDFLLRFDEGPARETVQRFVGLMPLTRQQWDGLIENAFNAAHELRRTEAATALEKIVERSPALAGLVGLAQAGNAARGVPGFTTPPKGTKRARTPGVQAIAQGSFFVTGMDAKQIEQTRGLLAQVIRGDKAVSTAGKDLRRIGVGDFVALATLKTGTDLTAARLETVYRTNLNRAQTQGQLDIVRDPTVKKFVPLVRFSATKDRRTRDTHKAMDGFIATVEQVDAQGIPTPAGFNCRCAWTPIPLVTAVTKGWCDEDGVPNYEAIKKANGNKQQLIDTGKFPDPGFISG